MRKSALVLAFTILALATGSAHAADKLHLERVDAKVMPTLRFYLTLVDRDGHVPSGKSKEDFRLSIDSAEQGAATGLMSFDETKEPVNLVIVAELGTAMNGVLEDEKRAISLLADSLPPKSKVGLIGYAGDTKRLTEQLTVAADVESAAKLMAIDSDSGAEMHMLDALAIAIDQLSAVPKNERKLIVVFSDGTNADMDPRIFTSKGKRAAEANIVIDTIGYNEFDISKTRNLGILAKQSNGTERIAKTPSDIGNHFNNIVDEIKKQYVATFEIALAGGDNKKHDLQVISGGDNGGAYSNTLTMPFPPRVHNPVTAGGSSSRWWLWLIIGLAAVGIIGLIAWLVFREKPEPMAVAPKPEAPKPVAPPVAQQPMKTMALDMSAGSGQVAVGWIVATSGKYADQTFKLKPARTLIGTGADCDVKVEDQFMSSHHCEVRFSGGNYKLFDLGSTNGIVVNDKKVSEHELVDNDQFRLGRTEFKFKSIT